ncbi:extracellular solute-binding protein [Ruminococcaceae bacterium OttesenSCG-928-L11]|nr:extracellular solute-binding protein [Ruminococcaceae bacterium OttesenSCG-928-L11]
MGKVLRFAAFLLAAAAVAAGCSGPDSREENTSATPGWQRTADTPVTLSWYINFSWFTSTWDDSLVARTITEETGAELHFITPSGNEWEKLNSMMASDTLPDFVTLGHWEPQVNQMIADGQVLALNQLADTYDPYFWEVAHPQRVAWYTMPDGNLYAYPNSSYAPSDYEQYNNIGANQAFLVRRDIYEGLGSPDMTTPEGFIQAVRNAAAQYGSLDGQPLIPIGLYDFDKDGCYSLEAILMNLLAVPFERDGAAYDRYTDPDYITWLKAFRQLCHEGYFPADIFVDRRLQTAEKVADGRYFCMLYQHTDIADQQKVVYEKYPGCQYIAVDGPKNAAGDPHTLPGVGINGWTVTLVGNNCKTPDRAIQLLSYLISEHGQLTTYCGVEGVTYDKVDGIPVIRPDVLALLNRDRVEYNRLYAADNTYWMLQDLAMQQQWQPEQHPPLDQPRQWTYPYTIYTGQYETTYAIGSEEANIHGKIREEWGRTLPQLLMADSDETFDRLLDSFCRKRDALGFALVQKEATRQMAAAKDRL